MKMKRMRHYCKNCSNASIWRENEDNENIRHTLKVNKSQAYFCGLAHCWVTAKSESGIMDHCTGWFWRGWKKLCCIGAITVFALCITTMALIIAYYVTRMMA